MARTKVNTYFEEDDDDNNKKRRGKFSCRPKAFLLTFTVAFLIGFYAVPLGVDRRVEDALRRSDALAESVLRYQMAASPTGIEIGNDNSAGTADHGDKKFLIFHKLEEAQGAGNHMHGLLAAHLLADEFERVLCVSNHYEDFHLAFKQTDPIAIQHCPDILKKHNKQPPNTRVEHTIELLNYREIPPNECSLKELLASSTRVLHISANTYPRWPHVPKHINFFKFYKPKPILLDILPYPRNQPPPIVVHLRHPDTKYQDSRKGVDDQSLKALGDLLPLDSSQHSPFLVTNNVAWFDYFEKHFGWSHPYWQIVMHSALGFQWEGRITEKPKPGGLLWRGNGDQELLEKKYAKLREQIGVDAWESLQLWADWITLLYAQKVYHTHSDFSLSAVHWSGAWSRTYDGLNHNGKLKLLKENWIEDGESPRVVDRANNGQLRNCDGKRGF